MYHPTFANVIRNFTVAFFDGIIFIALAGRGEIDFLARCQIATPVLIAVKPDVALIIIRSALADFRRIYQAHIIRIEALRVGLASLISDLLAHEAFPILAGRCPDLIVTLIRILPMHTVPWHELPKI